MKELKINTLDIPDELKGIMSTFVVVYEEGKEIKQQYKITYDYEYEISIVKAKYSKGGDEGLYEIALLKECRFVNCNLMQGESVLGYLDEEDVINVLKQINESKFNEKPNIKGLMKDFSKYLH